MTKHDHLLDRTWPLILQEREGPKQTESSKVSEISMMHGEENFRKIIINIFREVSEDNCMKQEIDAIKN